MSTSIRDRFSISPADIAKLRLHSGPRCDGATLRDRWSSYRVAGLCAGSGSHSQRDQCGCEAHPGLAFHWAPPWAPPWAAIILNSGHAAASDEDADRSGRHWRPIGAACRRLAMRWLVVWNVMTLDGYFEGRASGTSTSTRRSGAMLRPVSLGRIQRSFRCKPASSEVRRRYGDTGSVPQSGYAPRSPTLRRRSWATLGMVERSERNPHIGCVVVGEGKRRTAISAEGPCRDRLLR